MSIENDLARIASGVERLVALAEKSARQIAAETPPDKTYAEQRIEEVGAKRGPGRPKKVTPEPVETPVAEEPVVETPEEDDFLAAPPKTEPVLKATLDDVKAALVSLRTKKGKDIAYRILFENGNKASYLHGSTGAGVGNPDGELKPEFYGAVLKAANTALAA